MSTLSWDDSTKVWSWSGFSTKSNAGYDDEGNWYNDHWGYGIKKRPIGDSTWVLHILSASHVSGSTHSYNVFDNPTLYAQEGYEYQGYRVNVVGYVGSETQTYYEPSDIIAPLGGGYTGLTIPVNPVEVLSETTVLVEVVGGVTIHTISGKADVLGETTVLATVVGASNYSLTGTVRVNGSIVPNIRIIAVKTDGSKVFSAISNADGTFSVNVEVGTYQVLGAYMDGSGNKYSSVITPYVQVA